MKKQFIIANVFFALLMFSIDSCGSGAAKKEDKKEEVKTDAYTCPMKCNNGQTYDKPGDCPVCGMQLEKVIKS